MGNEWWMKDQHFKMESHTSSADVHAESPDSMSVSRHLMLSPADMQNNRFQHLTQNAADNAPHHQGRSRANTWPVNHSDGRDEEEDDDEDDEDQKTQKIQKTQNLQKTQKTQKTLATLPEEDGVQGGQSGSSSTENLSSHTVQEGNIGGMVNAKKKNSARRNPWGNMSYADLIERSIENSPEKRLTLSQIYDWLVQNIPYFKEKADTNSSAGWKNSVRHNLSLHNRFMRVQNETGTGKSSWWMVNQSAKFDKPSRRRAASMETKEYVKHKGRMKKTLIRDRVGGVGGVGGEGEGSQNSPVGDSSPFHLSVTDFRSRASSNASSYACLSPKSPACLDSDHPSPSGLSPQSWSTGSTGYDSTGSSLNGAFLFPYGEADFSNQLAKNVRISPAPANFDQPNRFSSAQTAGPAIGNYHPLATNGFYDTPRAYYAGQFPSIPEEPRGAGQYFQQPSSILQTGKIPENFLQNGKISENFSQNVSGGKVVSTSVVAESGVSGGNFTTYTPVSAYSHTTTGHGNGHGHGHVTTGHHSHSHGGHGHGGHGHGGHWSLPQDLESFTEPVQSFDFDWEELLQQEAAIERNLQSGNSPFAHVHHAGPGASAGRFLPTDTK